MRDVMSTFGCRFRARPIVWWKITKTVTVDNEDVFIAFRKWEV